MIASLLVVALLAQAPRAQGPTQVLGQYDAGTLPAASTVPGGVVFDSLQGKPYYSDGITWGPISSASTGWVTALDCDFTDAGNISIDAGDGNYSVCGKTWVALNSTNTVNRPGVVQGQGLVFQPSSGTNWYGVDHNAPAFYIPLTSVIPSASPTTAFRISMSVSGDWSENYHSIRMGIFSVMDGASTWGWYGATKGWNTVPATGLRWSSGWSTGQVTSTEGPENILITAQQQTTLVYPDGVAGNLAQASVDYEDGGSTFPTGQGYALGAAQPPTNQAFYSSGGMSAVNFYIAAQRAAAVATFTGVCRRIKIEYLP